MPGMGTKGGRETKWERDWVDEKLRGNEMRGMGTEAIGRNWARENEVAGH